MGDKIRQVSWSRSEPSSEPGRGPTEDEDLEKLDWAADEVRLALSAMPDAVSLDLPPGGRAAARVGDLLVEGKAADAFLDH